MTLIATNFEEISNIQKIFDELLQFIDNSPDAKILQKATDMTTFMHKSLELIILFPVLKLIN